MHLSHGILSHGRCILRYEKVELYSKAGTKGRYSQACTTANGASHYFSHKLRSFLSAIFLPVFTGQNYVREISKFKAHILKFLRPFFSFLPAEYNKLNFSYHFRA